ncbi:MAG: PKD domain-containing protein, partial [Bacteroidia bacterium]|nr:PKD domain-containing protein [Bacteroidia bacterium]
MKTRNIIVLFCCVLAGLFSRLNAQCNADFLYSSKACQNSTLSFTAKDTHSATQFAWNFDDPFSGTANIDSSKSPNHEFVTPGKYQVRLIAYDTNCRDTQTYQIEIYKLPDANFTVENGCANLLTQFKNSTTSDTADPIGQWKWLFNTDTSTQKSPQKTFNSIGNSTVKLIAISNTGCTDTVVKTISIYKKPTASTDLTEICQNGQVDFTADTIYNANTYRWNFGDSTFFTQRQVTHVYKTFGSITPKLTVDFGSTTCTIDLNNIKINKAPDARFYLPTDTFCFKNNNVCVVLNNIHQKIKSRSVLFDDGFLDDSSPLTDSIICHKYSDTSGGLYSITVELIDSTNCFARFTQKDAILIHPILIPDFTFNNGLGCFKTSVNIDNISNRTPPYISKYLWDFGDGNLDSIHWDNLNHDYTSDGLFNINLKITDKFGCSENKTSSKAVQNTNFVVDARIDSMKGICRNNNLIYFKQSTVTGATIQWNIPSGLMSTAFQFVYRFPLPGIYKPFVTVSKNGCDSTISLDSVTIHGPVANIGGITNRYQCQIKDTVYFSNASSTFLNNNISVFWDAGDYNASSCTTNIQNGINVGQNCRYSTDSAAFKHFYSPGSEGCYYVKLLVYDTSIGCRDSTYAPLPLRAPEAKGKFVASDTSACPGPETWKALTFNINLPEPTCLKYSWYVMWDSLAAIRSGNFDSLWVPNSVAHNYSYNDYAGDSSGYVSVGLIVENGTDTNGNICRDTGWFHKIVKVYHTNPNFTSSYNPAVYNCPNTTHYFFLKDSQQTAGTNFYWDFGDGSSLNTQSQNFVSHTFKKSGTYHVKLSVMADNGCTVDSSILINIGFQSNFSLSSAAKCVGDSFQISENNLYHNTGYSPSGLWRNPTRTAAGKEKIWYDLDDGNGFVDMGPNPLVKPKTPGNFSISMLSRDSVGCFDTLLNFASIKVSGMYAGFTTLYDTFLCAQTIQINNAATVVDSISNKSLNGDVITKWEYNFGNNYPQSFVPNPRRYFVTGNYQIRQIVVNSSGCIDTFIKNISVIGPKSKFSIISDTIGCAPLKITFQNNSQNASSYIWQFNDINNSSFSTKQDTNVAFKFLGYGNYYPRLVARGSFTINGTTQVCDDIYPDTSMALKKTVTVWELPKPNFTYSTNCATGTTTFKNTSAVSTSSLVYEKWFFGDGDSSLGPNPVHVYADTGTYKIVLKVRSAQGCEDSVVRNIVVSPSPIPYFGYNYNCHGTPTLFKDSSFAYNDRIYLWNWNFGDGTTSNQKNPQKTFAKDTTYQVKLTITNIAGCTENITRPILIYSKPVVKFNNNNTCDKQKVFAFNNTTSKQPIQSWKWSFGDGYTSTKWNDTHVYAGYGNYSIKLSIKSVNGCSDSITKITVISPNPSARIYLDTPNMCWKYHSIVFTDSSKIPLGTTIAAWNLGDLNTNNSKKFNYKYNQFGTYTIQLISKSDKGCNDTAWHNLTVHPMPEPAFTLNDSAQCSKYNSILFNDAGNIALGTYSIRWEFGDGTQSNNNPAVHHYNDTGAFNSKQILKSNKNCIDTATQKIRIWEMPKPGIAANDSGQCLLGNQFKFFNLSTYSKNNLSWNWNYGNGQKDTSKNPVFSYNKDSIYTVQLTAISTNNCKDTAALQVEVFPMPIANFLVNDSAQCLTNNQFNFTNLSTVKKGVLGYRWKFGDGDSSTALSPGHTFKKEGTYSINLIVKSSLGCSDTTSKNTTVHPMPLLNWAVNQPNFCILNQAFVFSDSSKIAYGSISGKW